MSSWNWNKSQRSTAAVIFLLNLVVVSSFVDTGRPCGFRDSINITNGKQDSQGNYLHEGIEYSPEFYAQFDFEYLNDTLVPVEPHIRGCICAIKGSCMRLCCDPSKDTCPDQISGYVRDNRTGVVVAVDDLTKRMPAVYGVPYCLKYLASQSIDNFTLSSVSCVVTKQKSFLIVKLSSTGRLVAFRRRLFHARSVLHSEIHRK